MQYLVSVIDDGTGPATPTEDAAIDVFNDRLRAEGHWAQVLYDDEAPEPLGAVDDERLRLIFTCCHPALAMETRMALTLRMVGGLTMPEIARAFLVQEAAMGQRITRAKAKIKAARIPYRRWHWQPSTALRTGWPAITPST